MTPLPRPRAVPSPGAGRRVLGLGARVLSVGTAIGLAGVLAGACLGGNDGSAEPGERVGEASSEIHSFHSGPPPWPHVLTCYGGCSAPHYDPSACNHHTSCGPIANGNWWYATERAAFHCGAKLKLERGNKCVVVDVEDNGPADWVEANAAAQCGTGYIIDTSPLVHDYFGGGCGWGECFIVNVTPVPDNTPTGPDGCNTCQCTAGQTQNAGCGNCGTHSRTCQADCHWGAWSACQGQGECAAGATQSEACCDCGHRNRTCGNDCQWNGWGACAGPDPNGGQTACDTSQPGPCASGSVRCVAGCIDCVSNYQPVAELCDGIDNDCSGVVDDGDPLVLGDPPPAFAARLHDVSFPQLLAPGELAAGWASFENVGTQAWPAEGVWLASSAAASGEVSPFRSAGWPAWDVAAVLDRDVAPNETAYFAFEILAPSEAGPASDELRLIDPKGQPVMCPDASVEIALTVGSERSLPPGDAAASEPEDAGGCSCRAAGAPRPSGPGPGLTLLGGLALLGAGWARRRHPA